MPSFEFEKSKDNFEFHEDLQEIEDLYHEYPEDNENDSSDLSVEREGQEDGGTASSNGSGKYKRKFMNTRDNADDNETSYVNSSQNNNDSNSNKRQTLPRNIQKPKKQPQHEQQHKKSTLGIPSWLANPVKISPHIVQTEDSCIDNPKWRISDQMNKRLKHNGISHFFPVQEAVLPVLMETRFSCTDVSPGDLCVAASTGSGKTLSYVLPVIETLSSRVLTRLRALVILPTRDLAFQVKNEFERYIKGTKLNVAMITGQASFHAEQNMLVSSHDTEYSTSPSSLVDILIATPGRLMDHLKGTSGLTLEHLRFLIVDEADRLLNQSFQNWLEEVLNCIEGKSINGQARKDLNFSSFSNENRDDNKVKNIWTQNGFQCNEFGLPLHQANSYRRDLNEKEISQKSLKFYTPVQKLLFSATLTRNPGKIASLKLYRPQFISVMASNLAAHEQLQSTVSVNVDTISNAEKIESKEIEDDQMGIDDSKTNDAIGEENDITIEEEDKTEGRFVTPVTLKECMIISENQNITKLLLLLNLIYNLNYEQGLLVFTKSVESAHRLAEFLTQYQSYREHHSQLEQEGHLPSNIQLGFKDIIFKAISSDLSLKDRQKVLNQFKNGSIQILICSDVIARGLDLGESVQFVVNYDVPTRLKTYVHRIGRTARAGRFGTAVTLLEKKEVRWFRQEIISQVHRQGQVKKLKIKESDFEELRFGYRQALNSLKEKVKGANHTNSKSNVHSSALENQTGIKEIDELETVELIAKKKLQILDEEADDVESIVSENNIKVDDLKLKTSKKLNDIFAEVFSSRKKKLQS